MAVGSAGSVGQIALRAVREEFLDPMGWVGADPSDDVAQVEGARPRGGHRGCRVIGREDRNALKSRNLRREDLGHGLPEGGLGLRAESSKCGKRLANPICRVSGSMLRG